MSVELAADIPTWFVWLAAVFFVVSAGASLVQTWYRWQLWKLEKRRNP